MRSSRLARLPSLRISEESSAKQKAAHSGDGGSENDAMHTRDAISAPTHGMPTARKRSQTAT
eukprot:4238734-Pleurochrysis_carterae.AAC.4